MARLVGQQKSVFGLDTFVIYVAGLPNGQKKNPKNLYPTVIAHKIRNRDTLMAQGITIRNNNEALTLKMSFNIECASEKCFLTVYFCYDRVALCTVFFFKLIAFKMKHSLLKCHSILIFLPLHFRPNYLTKYIIMYK